MISIRQLDFLYQSFKVEQGLVVSLYHFLSSRQHKPREPCSTFPKVEIDRELGLLVTGFIKREVC